MFHKIVKTANIIKQYKNWPTAICSRINSGKYEEKTYKLRNGINLLSRTLSSDFRITNEIWIDEVYEANETFKTKMDR
jgi:hypothetical protein